MSLDLTAGLGGDVAGLACTAATVAALSPEFLLWPAPASVPATLGFFKAASVDGRRALFTGAAVVLDSVGVRARVAGAVTAGVGAPLAAYLQPLRK